MNVKENIRIAIFSIRTNLLRSLLTMLGIIIGVSSVIAIITVGYAGRDYVVGMIKEMGSSSSVSITINQNTATASDYITSDDIEKIKEIDTVQYVSPTAISLGSISTAKTNGIGIAVGGTTDLNHIMGAQCSYGRFFSEEEFESARAVAIIDTTSAAALFGYENVVGQKLEYTYNGNSMSFKIIGVMDLLAMFGGNTDDLMSTMQNMGGMPMMTSGMILIPSTASAKLMGAQDRYDSCYIMTYEDSQLDAAGQEAVNILKARHNNFDRQVYVATNMASLVELLDAVISIFTLFIAAVSGISLVVGGIGVMNIMFVSVTERTREIGIRKALGARTSTILFQFLTESVILCMVGGVIGLILGVAGALAVSSLINVPITIKISTILIAVGFSSAIGIFFGIYPAKRAAQMPPIEALRRM